jgi:hypothetical protein
MHVEYNKAGYPLVAFGKKTLMTTTGGPANTAPKKNPGIITDTYDDKGTADTYNIWDWGSDNLFPENALVDIEKSTVLSSGLKYKMQLLMGQGIYPTKLDGFEKDGREILSVMDNAVLRSEARSRIIRRYLSMTVRDIFKFGMGFPTLTFSADGQKCFGPFVLNARSCRLERDANDETIIKNMLVADWRDPKNIKKIMMLDAMDPEGQLDDMRSLGKTKNLVCVYPLMNDFSNNYLYALPDWYVAKNAGWVDISQSVPKMLKKIYENQITWKWHIKIPYAYWEKKYPATEYKDKKARQALINTDLDNFESNLIGEDNVQKAIITHFEINPNNGKAEEQWVIEALDNKFKTETNLIESAVADSNILFSINVNPTVMGAGLPGAGPYAGKTGGSDIRESFLVNVALAWLDRQNVLDPLECKTRFNGIDDCEWRFQNMLLTTLDSGAGTTKNLG